MKAEDSLEALIGPFRLRRVVRETLERGLLMPFSVSMLNGKAAGRLPRQQSMRGVSCVGCVSTVVFTRCMRRSQ